jgi:hypothetical protein
MARSVGDRCNQPIKSARYFSRDRWWGEREEEWERGMHARALALALARF